MKTAVFRQGNNSPLSVVICGVLHWGSRKIQFLKQESHEGKNCPDSACFMLDTVPTTWGPVQVLFNPSLKTVVPGLCRIYPQHLRVAEREGVLTAVFSQPRRNTLQGDSPHSQSQMTKV